MHARLWLPGLLLGSSLILAGARPARACGGFFSETQADVVSASDVRVLLVQASGRTHQYVQVGYQGEARRFAWVYPVAGNPEVEEVVDSPFPALEQLTRPRISIAIPSEGGGGFGCGAAADTKVGRSIEPEPSVTVWQSGQVGAFDYVVITARAAQDLLDWLQQNGFAIPASTRPVLDHYLAQGWFFVAMKVSVQRVSGAVPATTVVRLSYPSTELRYPLRMLSLSPASRTRLEIYLVTPEGMRPASPFSTLSIPVARLRATSPSTHNYEELFEEQLQLDPRGLILEYSYQHWSSGQSVLSEWSEVTHLARFRTTLGPAQMSEDLVFRSASLPELVPGYNLIYQQGVQAGLPAPLALLGLACGLGAVLRRLRCRGR